MLHTALDNTFHQTFESLQVKSIYQIFYKFKKHALEKSFQKKITFLQQTKHKRITWEFPGKKNKEKKVKGSVKKFEL